MKEPSLKKTEAHAEMSAKDEEDTYRRCGSEI